MALPNGGGRSLSTVAMLVLTAVTLLTLDGRNFGPVERLQNGLRDVIAPVRSAADDIVSPFGNAWNGITDYDAVTAENKALRAEIERIRGEGIRDESAVEELEALKAEVGLEVDDYLVKIAQVVGGPVGNFPQFTVEIDVGRNNALLENMAVITAGGLVGMVTRVGADRAEVELVTDPGFVIGVELGDGVVIAQGTGDGETLRVDQNLSQIGEVAVGDPVSTRSSLIPPGLPVGRVAEIVRDDDGVLEEIVIELSADPGKLEFVTVVLVDPAVIDEARTDVLGNEVPGIPATTTTTIAPTTTTGSP